MTKSSIHDVFGADKLSIPNTPENLTKLNIKQMTERYFTQRAFVK